MTESISLHTLAKVPGAAMAAVADDIAEEATDEADDAAEDPADAAEEATDDAEDAVSDVVELPQAVTPRANAAAAHAERTVFTRIVMVISLVKVYRIVGENRRDPRSWSFDRGSLENAQDQCAWP